MLRYIDELSVLR